MKKLSCAALVVASCLAASSAFAVTAHSGVYVSAKGGYAWPAINAGTFAGTASTVDNKGLVYGGDIGYDYALDTNYLIGAEFGYSEDGKVDVTGVSSAYAKTKLSDWHLLATGTYLMDNGFNIFGKAGAARVHSSESDNLDGYESSSATKTVPQLGLGAGYLMDLNTSGSLNTFVEYDHIFGKNYRNDSTSNSDKPATMDILKVGVTYKFNT